MYTSKCILWVFLVACVVAANGDVLKSWGDGTPGTDFTWFPDENRLIIQHGNALNYKFWVHDGSEAPGTGVINNITVDPNAVGNFTLLIEHPEGYAGALDWNEGDLRYDAGTSTVTGIKVAGNLAAADKEVVLDWLDGSIEVGGCVDKLSICAWAADLGDSIAVAGDAEEISIFNDCWGDIFVGGDMRDLYMSDCHGDIDVDGNLVGVLHVDSSLWNTGMIYVGGNVIPEALLVVGSCVDGEISVAGDCEGGMVLGRRVAPEAYVGVNGSLSGHIYFGSGARLDGVLDVRGSVSGGIYFDAGADVYGLLEIGGSLSGGIYFYERGDLWGILDVGGDLLGEITFGFGGGTAGSLSSTFALMRPVGPHGTGFS